MSLKRPQRSLLFAALVALPLGAALQPGAAVLAQDSASASAEAMAPSVEATEGRSVLTAEQIAADRAAWKSADCASCHGWSGNGHDTGPVPPGPSLRETQLDLAGLREVIQCGRPGTRMPSHDRLAYVDDRCYGMKSADLGNTKPPKGTPLRPADMEAIAAYVDGFLKGKGTVTKAECEEDYGAGNAVCANYN